MLHIKLTQFAVRGALPPRRSESPVCATDNKPSCTLHLLGSFIGSRGFSSLERRPEFWVLHPSEHQPSSWHPAPLGSVWGPCSWLPCREAAGPNLLGSRVLTAHLAGLFSEGRGVRQIFVCHQCHRGPSWSAQYEQRGPLVSMTLTCVWGPWWVAWGSPWRARKRFLRRPYMLGIIKWQWDSLSPSLESRGGHVRAPLTAIHSEALWDTFAFRPHEVLIV